jgi:ribosomal protein S6
MPVKRYEALFILDTVSIEDSIDEAVARVAKEIESVGAKIENTQKMDRKQFARVVDKRRPSGYYVNFIFNAEPNLIEAINQRFDRNNQVNRIIITLAPAKKAA